MTPTKHKVVGLMSGTSLDGLDIALCEFALEKDNWQFNIISAETLEFERDLKNQLSDATNLTGIELNLLDHELGKWMGESVRSFSQKQKIHADLIASHGHTVFHQPEKGITVQIGNLNQIYVQNGIPVVGDFRSLDVALGGQGAPLVPIGDELLFHHYDCCLNLGGISNISYRDEYSQKTIAYDICPVNIVLNTLSQKKGAPFDKNGAFASSGEVNDNLLDQLNGLTYYRLEGPKSLGIEWINEHIFPLLDEYHISVEDKLATFCQHIAYQIEWQLVNRPIHRKTNSLLLTGGGAFNTELLNRIKAQLKNQMEVVVPEKNIIIYKEALIFAFLGLLKWKNMTNVLCSVTGAQRNSISGVIING